MGSNIAVVICNYNKKDYIINCIKSVKKSTYRYFDIYVVDNASTDGSVDSINKEFGNEVTLLINAENLGGSGGFNTGIKAVVDKGYKYIYLLDNDVSIDSYALENLYNYMEKNEEVAVSGSKIYFMDKPNNVQEFGSFIDFDNYNMRLENRGRLDLNINESVECDYVPACSALFRADALRQVGIIDEDYFVYWDDIDLCYRLKIAGYKIIANPNSMVWHKGGGTVRKNTFGTYYFWRNRVHFFTKYCSDDEMEKFSLKLFDEIFQAIYSCNYIGKYSSARTIIMAVHDALNNMRGKSLDGRIFEVENIQDRVEHIINAKKNILVINDSKIEILKDVIHKINLSNSIIDIMTEKPQELEDEFKEYNIQGIKKIEDISKYDLVFKTCYHIFDVRNNIEDNIIYVDRFFNVIASKSDITYVENYDNNYNALKNILYPLLFDGLLALKRIL